MIIENLNVKNTEYIYEVAIDNVCDSVQWYYNNIDEAIEKAKKEKELCNDNDITVTELMWNDEEKEYSYTYDENGGLEGIVFTI